MATKAAKQQEMFSLIESWKSSGQTQQEFCKSQGLAYSGFHYWYKKYRQGNSIQAPAFVPVHVHGPVAGSPLAELVMPDGRRLTIYRAIDVSYLRALVS